MTLEAREQTPDAETPGDDAPQGHKPQSLVLNFFGSAVMDRDLPPIPTTVFLQVLGSLGVTEAAARATLARMTKNQMLDRIQVGRAAHYRLSASAERLVRDASLRISSPHPFDHPDGHWTLLTYSMPESRRDLRHRVRATLTWAGFGGLRDGVWIAPGVVDVGKVLAAADLREVAELAAWFDASPLPGVQIEGLIRTAWSVDGIKRQHEAFIETWWSWSDEDPLAQVTLLSADWARLLRADPGLPARHLSSDWPAAQSAAVYRRCIASLQPSAHERLDIELGLKPRG